MPVLFIGHGNPMNAIADNAFTQTLNALGRALPRPKAVLCISAHWMTEGTWITHMAKPKTIHDFYGFPPPLFSVQYPAPGAPALADRIRAQVEQPAIQADDDTWGLDHGTWSVLRHLYPAADVPVLQLSIYMAQPSEYHFRLGEALRPLRDEGVLIVGSGNIVHNLRQMGWEDGAKPLRWAVEFDAWVKEQLERRNYNAIQNDSLRTEAGRLSVPSPDHWYPLLYPLGAALPEDQLRFEYEGIENGSISMRCFSLGRMDG